jgi:hypothetical protein
MRFLFLVFIVGVFMLGCNSGSDVPASAPRITNLTITPEVICVGSVADISFILTDPNEDEIIGGVGLSTGEHGGVNPSIGNVPSGTTVVTRFDAASSGRHNHQVKMKVVVTDIGGLQGQPAEIEFFVFNC